MYLEEASMLYLYVPRLSMIGMTLAGGSLYHKAIVGLALSSLYPLSSQYHTIYRNHHTNSLPSCVPFYESLLLCID